MDQSLRNKLRNVVTHCRRLLEDAVAQVLQGQFGIHATGNDGAANVDGQVLPIKVAPLQGDQLRASHPSAEGKDHHGATWFPVHSPARCEPRCSPP